MESWHSSTLTVDWQIHHILVVSLLSPQSVLWFYSICCTGEAVCAKSNYDIISQTEWDRRIRRTTKKQIPVWVLTPWAEDNKEMASRQHLTLWLEMHLKFFPPVFVVTKCEHHMTTSSCLFVLSGVFMSGSRWTLKNMQALPHEHPQLLLWHNVVMVKGNWVSSMHFFKDIIMTTWSNLEIQLTLYPRFPH